MTLTSNSNDLRKAAAEARGALVDAVKKQPGIALNDMYRDFAQGSPKWPEPALRTAIWDLIAERQLIVRRGNKLFPPNS